MQLFDSKLHSQILEERINNEIRELKVIPTLGIVQIGDDPVSSKFITLKQNLCAKFGIPVKLLHISHELPEEQISSICEDFFADSSISGVIVQLPLPKATLYKILDKIPLKKDIDLLSSSARFKNTNSSFRLYSPVCRAVEYFMDSIKLPIIGTEISILGYGFLVGQPLLDYLLQQGAKVSVYDKNTSNSEISSKVEFKGIYNPGTQINSQLVISSAGVPNLLLGQDLMSKTSVIDLGSSMVNNITVGDLNMDSELTHLGMIAPSPKGLGPLVVRFLVLNLLEYTK